jgi:Pectate lyase superfamily protein
VKLDAEVVSEYDQGSIMTSKRNDSIVELRRSLLLGGVVGATAVVSKTAQADTAFTNFAFRTKAAPASRTMPERLSDVQNVKDWGALGNGAHDDTGAIQNAINYCINNGTGGYYGGTVFFPPGFYKVTSLYVGTDNATYQSARVRLIGSGREATFLRPTAANWCISKGGKTYECIEAIENVNCWGGSLGSVQITGSNISIVSVRFSGTFGIDATQATNAYICNCSGAGASPGSANAGPAKGQAFCPDGTIGIALGSGCFAYDCRPINFDVAIALSGSGANAISTSADTCNTGYRMGWGVSSNVATEIAAIGCTIQGGQTERTNCSYELYNCDGCAIFGCEGSGTIGLPFESKIDHGS